MKKQVESATSFKTKVSVGPDRNVPGDSNSFSHQLKGDYLKNALAGTIEIVGDIVHTDWSYLFEALQPEKRPERATKASAGHTHSASLDQRRKAAVAHANSSDRKRRGKV